LTTLALLLAVGACSKSDSDRRAVESAPSRETRSSGTSRATTTTSSSREGTQALCDAAAEARRAFDTSIDHPDDQQLAAAFVEELNAVGVAAYAAEDPDIAALGRAVGGNNLATNLLPLLEACADAGYG
jgi:hypothetical protein